VLNGCAELTDGTHLVWPEGLAHYVEEHNVRLPDEIIALMDEVPAPVDENEFYERLMIGRDLVIDRDWWQQLTGQ
jgi:hypothetical protein